jgi:hypothetical protein
MTKSQGKPQGLSMGVAPQPEPMADDPTSAALMQLRGTAGITRTQVDYQTAIVVQRPRALKEIETAIIYEAAQMGEDFIYHWRQATTDARLDEGDGKTTIEGMSIDGAMVCLRNWGNCACPIDLMDETPTHFLLKAVFVDLEKGFTFPRLYRQRKSGGPGGKMAGDRAEDISFQIGQSKAQRNVVDKALPRWLINRAIEAAKGAAAERYKDLAVHVPRAISGYAAFGVSQAQLEARLRKPAADWTPFDLLTLSLLARAIRDKETSVGTEFPAPTPEADAQGAAVSETITTTGDAVEDKPADSGTVVGAGKPADGDRKPEDKPQDKPGDAGAGAPPPAKAPEQPAFKPPPPPKGKQ